MSGNILEESCGLGGTVSGDGEEGGGLGKRDDDLQGDESIAEAFQEENEEDGGDRMIRELNHLLRIFPKEIWTMITENLEDPEDLENLRNASLFFRNLFEDKLVVLLFPKVWKILADQYLAKFETDLSFNDARSGNMTARCCGSYPNPEYRRTPCEECGNLHGIKWYSGILRLRLVCQTWSSVMDHAFQNQLTNYGWIDEPVGGQFSNHFRYNFSPEGGQNPSEFRQHFGTTHGPALVGDLSRNPFITRTLRITYQLTANNREFYIQILQFLQSYGHHVWYCHLETSFVDVAGHAYMFVSGMLRHLPNVKVLWLERSLSDFTGGNSSTNVDWIRRIIRVNGLPTLQHLLFIRVTRFPLIIFNELIRTNSHVSQLEVDKFRPSDEASALYSIPLPNLKQLSLEIQEDADFLNLETSPHPAWPLQKLYLNFRQFHPISLRRIFTLLEDKWSNTLTELIFCIGGVDDPTRFLEDFKTCRLNLPILTRLELLIPFFFSLDFILPMRDNLEVLDVTVPIWVKISARRNKPSIRAAEKDQQVKLFSCGDRPLESNIWTLFPNLKKIILNRVGEPVTRCSKVKVWSQTRARNRRRQ